MKGRLTTRGVVKRRNGSIKGMQKMVTNGHTAGKNAKRSASARAKFQPVSLAKVRLPSEENKS